MYSANFFLTIMYKCQFEIMRSANTTTSKYFLLKITIMKISDFTKHICDDLGFRCFLWDKSSAGRPCSFHGTKFSFEPYLSVSLNDDGSHGFGLNQEDE